MCRHKPHGLVPDIRVNGTLADRNFHGSESASGVRIHIKGMSRIMYSANSLLMKCNVWNLFCRRRRRCSINIKKKYHHQHESI